MKFLMFLEDLAFSHWVKEAPTIWAFPMILFVHTFGMSIVAGGSAMLDMIVLGFWPAVPKKPFARVFPVLWIGFWINAVTGTMMLVADATTKLTTIDFYIKMACVFAGMYILVKMRHQVFEDPRLDIAPVSSHAKKLAWMSIGFWFGAIICGRLLAYVK